MTLHDKTPAMQDSRVDRLSLATPGPSDTALAQYAGRDLQPNRGIPLNLARIDAVRVNTSAVERRAQTLVTRRTVKKEWQAAWLLRAITCMDLTTLSGDDTDERVRRLCAKARQPVQQELTQNSEWRGSRSRLRQCASITRLWKRRAGPWRAAGSMWLRSRLVFPPDFRHSGSASMKFAARWKRGRTKSTWSSRAVTFLEEGGKRFTMKSRRSKTPADRHT